MKRIVQFDVDGVLADFSAGYDRLCMKLGVEPPGPDAPWDAKWNPVVWEEIKSSLTFWEQLPALVHDRVFHHITDLVADVYFVTARPGRRTKWQTERWLFDHEVRDGTVIVTGRKAEFAQAVGVTHAIDDKAGNAVATQYLASKTKSYLLDAPYNRWDQSILGTKVIRVNTVEEFLSQVEAA